MIITRYINGIQFCEEDLTAVNTDGVSHDFGSAVENVVSSVRYRFKKSPRNKPVNDIIESAVDTEQLFELR